MPDGVTSAPGSADSDPFRTVFEHAGDAMLLADDERRYVDANQAACALLGLDRSAIVGRTIEEFASASTRAALVDGWASFLESSEATGEYGLATPRGTRQVKFRTVANVFPSRHLSILRDESDPQRGEGERRLFVDIVSALRVGLHVYQLEHIDDDPGDLRMIYANAATMNASGIPPSAIIGRKLRDIFPPFMETEIPALYAEVARGGASRSLGDVEYGDDRVEKSVFAASLFPLPGRRVGVAFNDVTSERRSEEGALATLESMTEAFYTLAPDWTITYVNAQSEVFLRKAREDLLGRNLWEQFPEAVNTPFHEQFLRAAREQVAVEFEEYYPPFDAWFAVRAYPTRTGLAVYYEDVTKRREIESQLRQSQKLEAVGQLAGGVAHDFNNMLTVIAGYTTLALARLETDMPFVERALGEIKTASESGTALTAKLLTFARKQPHVPVVVDVNEVVSAALNLVQPLVRENIVVHRRLNAKDGNVLVEVAEIEQALVNLVINSSYAMPNGGNLFATTECIAIDTSSASELEPGRYVSVAITDDGYGMDEHTRSQIFDPFYTTKPAGEGTGLGLSTAHGTIGQSGGDISVVSAPGEGTTVTIRLPCSNLPLPTRRGKNPSPLTTSAGERILLVEDDDTVRRLVLDILRSCRYDVVEARDPEEALALCDAEAFDLMLTDIVMPGRNGPTLAREVVARQPDIRVLFMSGYNPEASTGLHLDGSSTGFLSKPFSPDSLSRAIRELLDRPRVDSLTAGARAGDH
jgi:signal transduction histidine kinase/ActR/RegA family two-component response regulator